MPSGFLFNSFEFPIHKRIDFMSENQAKSQNNNNDTMHQEHISSPSSINEMETRFEKKRKEDELNAQYYYLSYPRHKSKEQSQQKESSP